MMNDLNVFWSQSNYSVDGTCSIQFSCLENEVTMYGVMRGGAMYGVLQT